MFSSRTFRWRQSLITLALVTAGAPLARAAEITPARLSAALAQLDTLTPSVLQKSGVPGVAIVVVYNDQVVYMKGFGVREAGRPDAVDPDTVFQLASMSKPIASTIVSSLVSDGTVGWNDPAASHMPQLQMFDPWVTRQVTIADLFSHRSGLPGGAGDDLESVGFGRTEILRRLRFLEPASSLRSAYAYSNFGLTAGAQAAAQAAGKAWEDLAAQRLYQPLGMRNTSSRYADYAAASNRAVLHVWEQGRWAPTFKRQPDAQSPAGGVSSTARDLAQWMRLELGNGMVDGRRLIAADALAQTHQPMIARGPNPVTGDTSFYGLGWNVDIDARGRVHWTHAGAFSQGAQTVVNLLPAEHLGITVLTNAFPSGVPDGLVNSFYDVALNGSLTQDWVALWTKAYDGLTASFASVGAAYVTGPTAPLPALPLGAYAGTYTNDYFGLLEITQENDHLILQLGPQHKSFHLTHFDQNIFTYLPEPEPPAALGGVTFTVGPDRLAQSVVLENYNGDGQGTFTRVQPPK
ncbi:serine hydrolase [Deinococcus detaillensis]|uniref:Serine hydrolase n=1 Tax=Deinococcus detaillensis TaxID=2592048 RepID=A0A553UZC5_9DEIO|nr:serine hydrolase [Deinococcus detaillensis]TSA85530.1 serine hydrolase [Deinococcus detaillensis]